MTTISHDPFSRTSTVRATRKPPGLCSWCGNTARFQYGTESDSISARKFLDMDRQGRARLFCSISCRRAFYS